MGILRTHIDTGNWNHLETAIPDPEPDFEQIQEWMEEGGCEATDGCWVEHDGTCPHGKTSWFLKLGLI